VNVNPIQVRYRTALRLVRRAARTADRAEIVQTSRAARCATVTRFL